MNSITPPDKRVEFTFDGKKVIAISGQTLAGALLEQGVRTLRKTRIKGIPRGVFCGIGICFDCLVVIDGLPNQRACLTEVRDGLTVETQDGLGSLP
ncbi:MAG: (2Fe-2S)-binding protein [Actinobacteria bacterium]|nr:(2Fe-2S)-binding protein [Actinomycetota bacterium]